MKMVLAVSRCFCRIPEGLSRDGGRSGGWRSLMASMLLLAGSVVVPGESLWAQAARSAKPSNSVPVPGSKQTSDDEPFDKGPNTQVETVPPLTDQQALDSWEVPEGFQWNLFASAPMISQPIAATFDRHGRMWLAENYTYSERPNIFQRDKSDRILILEDKDQDGQADQARVFWSEGKLLSSVEVGMGGVWALCSPHLLFLPDRDEDGVLDGPPQIILDGFEDQEVGHNMVNGLRWGPDGWLYGRHGIQATSHVGRPGSEQQHRVAMNCCIWRYHPVAQKLEVVCHGTTNPWGHDWTAEGELFFINTVIGHLWHAVPNSHFQRMYGEDLIPNTFQLTAQVADHVHWDASQEAWQAVQKQASDATNAAGGGHAHSGMLISQQPNWPATMQNQVWTVNYHGRRINRDQLQRHGSTFTALHQGDILQTADPWFRGVDLIHGPDQSMFVLDWQDIGECHENDGVHRSSGRIYRLTPDARGNSNSSHSGNNVRWWVERLTSDDVLQQRLARTQLQTLSFSEAAPEFELRTELASQLKAKLKDGQASELTAVRCLWALQAMGSITEADLFSVLDDDRPLLRRWAVRLLADGIGFTLVDGVPVVAEMSPGLTLGTLARETVDQLLRLAGEEQDSLVQVYLASSMRRMNLEDRWAMAMILGKDARWEGDRVFPLLLWYGLEPAVVSHAAGLPELFDRCPLSLVRQFSVRRLAVESIDHPEVLAVISQLIKQTDETGLKQILTGLSDGWEGWTGLPAPESWGTWQTAFAKLNDEDSRQRLDQLQGTFAQDKSFGQLVNLAGDGSKSLTIRSNALEAIGRSLKTVNDESKWQSAEVQQAIATLRKFAADRFLASAAVKGMVASGRLLEPLLEQYHQCHPSVRAEVLQAAGEYRPSAKRMLTLVTDGRIPKEDVTPYVLRQLELLNDEGIRSQLQSIWPNRSSFRADQLAQIGEWQERLSTEKLAKADVAAGKEVFQKQCANCHKLFGEGGVVGPELTGGQRSNLTYWLQNLLAPSAEVGTGFRMSLILMQDGRTLSGVITEKTTQSFRLTTQKERLLIQMKDVEEIQASELSLMPDGILDQLESQQVVDLLGYLMSQPKVGGPAKTEATATDASPSTTDNKEETTSARHKASWLDFPKDEEGYRQLWKDDKRGTEDAMWSVAKKSFFEKAGSVQWEDQTLSLKRGTPGTGVVAAFEVPRNQYEIEFEARRTEGTDFFCGLTFPFDQQQATLILGGWGGSTVGISNVNRFSAVENSTSRTVKFDNDRWYKIRFRVTEDLIECFLDDQPLFWLDPLDKTLETWFEQKPMEPLGLASWNSSAEIRGLRMKVVPKSEGEEE